jgi:hypothetical protein
VVRVEVWTLIDRPVEEVFRFVEDEANIPKWDSDLLKATKTSDGPIGVNPCGSTSTRRVKRVEPPSERNLYANPFRIRPLSCPLLFPRQPAALQPPNRGDRHLGRAFDTPS